MPLCNSDILDLEKKKLSMENSHSKNASQMSQHSTDINLQFAGDHNLTDYNFGLFHFNTSSNWTQDYSNDTVVATREKTWFLHEFHLIKAVVLVVVISVLLVSTCRLVLKNFSKFAEPRKDHHFDI